MKSVDATIGVFALALWVGAASIGCRGKEESSPPAPPAETTGPSLPTGPWDAARWAEIPAPSRAPIGVPLMTGAFVLDGKLTEWADALSVPIRSDALAIYLQGPQEWRGPQDASLESFAAWTPDALVIAFAVWDDELFNDRPPEVPWDHDCVSFAIETGPPPAEGADDTRERLSFLVVPPRGDQPAVAHTFPPAKAQQVAFMATRTRHGYAVEAVIPWATIGVADATIGDPMAMRFNLIDYDLRDGEQVVPRGFSWHRSWYRSFTRRPPGELAEAVLISRLTRSPETDLESEVYLNVDTCPAPQDPTLPIRVDLGMNVGRAAGAIELHLADWHSRRALTATLDLTGTGSEWGERKSAAYDLPLANIPHGRYRLTATVLSDDGEPLGTVWRDVLITRGFAERALASVGAAGLPALAQTQPFAALNWLLAAGNIERFKQRALQRNIPPLTDQARELCARMALLEMSVLPPGDSLYALLAAGTDSGAQVIVEFPDAATGYVNIYWGPLPLATVGVTLFDDDAEVSLGGPPNATLEGMPARVWEDPPGVTRVQALRGHRVFSARSPSAEVAKTAVAAVAAGKPITAAQVDALRVALAQEIEIVQVHPLPLVPDDMKLYVGDVHMHTIFSDGSYSPMYMALQSFCNGMDFSVITDHNDIVGGQIAQAHAAHYGFGHSIIVGDEITTSWAHLNGYPLREIVDWELAPYELVRSVHAQGAAIQWNHPDANSEWGKVGFASGLGPLGVDAWEHVPPAYDQWRRQGRLPTLVGSTDEHRGYFFNVERSVIFAPSASGVDVADAVRRGHVCVFDPTLLRVVYGAPQMIGRVREAMLEGKTLHERRQAAIAAALANVNIVGLIDSSGQRKVDADQAAEILRALQGRGDHSE